MRKLKLQMQMTVDGHVAGPNGELDWMALPWDEELNGYVAELIEPVDCIVLGRKLAQGFIPYWANVPEGEDPRGAEKYNGTQKVVFTKTLDSTDWANTVLAKGELTDEILRLKGQPGGDIIAYGGVTFVSALIRNALVDDLYLLVNPVAIGVGQSIFSGLEQRQQYRFIDAKPFPCGVTVLHFRLAEAAD